MACYSPLTAWKGPGGSITFKQKQGYYDKPLSLACGQCIGCRLEKQRNWAIRATHEAQMHDKNCFLTLTYSDADLPTDRSLDVQHWQKFAKRVRKNVGPFRFLHCGEYGPVNLRPHYHALIFGLDFTEDSIPLAGRNPGHELRVSAQLTKLWPHGFHTVGPITSATTNYVASYTVKKVTGPAKETAYQRVHASTGECWDVKPEYATMSRNKGLGHSWFQKFHDDVYPSNFVVFNAQPVTPPPYYDQLLANDDPTLASKMIQQRRQHTKENAWNHTTERLFVRETVAKSKLNLSRPKALD